MKTLITSLFLFIIVSYSQAQERKLYHIADNLYQYGYLNEEGEISQSGYYKKINGVYEPHGLWVDRSGNKTKAKYDNGVMVWIKIKGQRKYTYEEIQIRKMLNKIERLEEQILVLSN